MFWEDLIKGGGGVKLEQAKILIDAINETDYEPNDWENEFIESILKRGNDLSDKQIKCIQNIYAKATGGGIYENKKKI